MEEPDIAGKFVVISDPESTQQVVRDKNQCEFQALDNDKHYRFKVAAINDNFRIEANWTEQTKPDPKKERRLYKQERDDVADKIMKLRRKKDKEKRKK
eukprot:TRINITY_DN28867_c0_g1_i1.p1 TRINITY_DN28867_c0_g1~~TRINITY_DN28867_c0_g1_i1.p1  ORF type:complete len:107 (+),score=18.74 TRINITY_DN28867_c0_g1_i1:28-321(+)